MSLIKSEQEIEIIAQGGKMLAKIVNELKKRVKPGIATSYLDKVAEDLVLKYGGKCSFKGYQGFPACLCTSVNSEIVHGLPSETKIIKDGDIISLDLGLLYKGFHTDMAITLAVGAVPCQVKKLIEVTEESLFKGIAEIRPGKRLGDIGNTIQKYVESAGFNVVRNLCGHGIGKEIHEDPQILNYGEKNKGQKIKQGMVLCLEPMTTIGDWKLKKSKDNFGYQTVDGSLSCHFEHTVVVLKGGAKILTML